MTDKRAKALDVATTVAPAAVALATGDPGVAFVVTAATLALREAAAIAMQRFDRSRDERAGAVLAKAAKDAGLSVEKLMERLQASPQGEELLCAVLNAARDAALTAKLYALAGSLVRGAIDEANVTNESNFVRALADLDVAAVALLESFTRSANDLGLGNGHPDFDNAPDSLTIDQLRLALPPLADYLDPSLAVLVRHGLVVPLTFFGAVLGAAAEVPATTWKITHFGRVSCQYLAGVGNLLR